MVQQLEILLGSVGVILGIFFAVYLLFSAKRLPKANLFLAIYLLTFSLRIGKSVFHYFYEIDGQIRNFFLVILFCAGPSVWLYSKYLIKEGQAVSRRDYAHYGLFLALLPVFWLIPNGGPQEYSVIFAVFYNAIIVHLLCYCVFSIWWLVKNNFLQFADQDPIKKRWLFYFLGSNLLLVIIYFLISISLFPFYIGLSFLFSVIVIFYSIWALNNPELFEITITKYEKSTIGYADAAQIVNKVKDHFTKKKPYLNSKLSLKMLGEEVGVTKKELSQAINQIEKVNYSQFILRYRINEAKRLLQSKSHQNLTIASIAYDSGFNSISSFNTGFKKITGITPLAFQKTLSIR